MNSSIDRKQGVIAFIVTLLFVYGGVNYSFSDWPQWRGPQGTGVSDTAEPPTQWDRQTNVLWKSPLPGRGHSTPIVWKDRVFVTTAIKTGPPLEPKRSGRPGAHDNLPVDSAYQFVVLALNRATGKEIWRRTVHQAVPVEGGHSSASLASASPVTDGEHLIVTFGSHGLFGLDTDGNLLWTKQFGTMHTKHGHGEGSSPALFQDRVIVNWDHEGQSFVVALDKTNGNEIWRRRRQEVTSWSSPIVIRTDESAQVIVCGTERVRGYDFQSGDTIWECAGLSANIVATPVFKDGILYVGSSYDHRALMAIRIAGAQGDISDSDHVLWVRHRGTPYVPSPLLYDNALYFLTHYQNVLTRIDGPSGDDAPGAMRMGMLGNIYASPVGAAGRIYITDLDGVTLVLSHSDVPRVIAVNRIDEAVSASAAISGECLFLRGERHLFCIKESN